MANISITGNFSTTYPEIKPTDPVIFSAENDKLSRLLSNDNYLKNEFENMRHIITVRLRGIAMPDYGIWGEGSIQPVTLETGVYTGTAEVSITHEGKEYDINMSTDGQNAPDGTLILKLLED